MADLVTRDDVDAAGDTAAVAVRTRPGRAG